MIGTFVRPNSKHSMEWRTNYVWKQFVCGVESSLWCVFFFSHHSVIKKSSAKGALKTVLCKPSQSKWSNASMTNVCLLKWSTFISNVEVRFSHVMIFLLLLLIYCWYLNDVCSSQPVPQFMFEKYDNVRMWIHKFRMICTNRIYLTCFTIHMRHKWDFSHFSFIFPLIGFIRVFVSCTIDRTADVWKCLAFKNDREKEWKRVLCRLCVANFICFSLPLFIIIKCTSCSN